MLTAKQIAEETQIDLHTTQYRLSELRRKDKVKAQQFGTTYVYPDSAIEKVKNYTGQE